MNRHQRRAQYAVPSRSYPHRQPNQRVMGEVNRGMNQIQKFIMRGIVLADYAAGKLPINRRPFSFKSLALGIKRGIAGV